MAISYSQLGHGFEATPGDQVLGPRRWAGARAWHFAGCMRPVPRRSAPHQLAGAHFALCAGVPGPGAGPPVGIRVPRGGRLSPQSLLRISCSWANLRFPGATHGSIVELSTRPHPRRRTTGHGRAHEASVVEASWASGERRAARLRKYHDLLSSTPRRASHKSRLSSREGKTGRKARFSAAIN